MKNLTLKAILVLGAGIAALASKAKGTDQEKETADILDAFKAHEAELLAVDKDITGLKDQILAEREEASATIKELKSELDSALDVKEAKTDELVVTVDKVKYVVNHGSHPHTKQELADSPELAKKILKIDGQQALTKL